MIFFDTIIFALNIYCSIWHIVNHNFILGCLAAVVAGGLIPGIIQNIKKV